MRPDNLFDYFIEYGSAMARLRQDYVLQWGARTLLITLLASLVIGLLALYYQTRNLRYVVQTVRRFSRGDLAARIRVRSSSEVAQLASTFNTMADRLTTTIADLRQSEQVRRNLVSGPAFRTICGRPSRLFMAMPKRWP